jgi:hypothetical protein
MAYEVPFIPPQANNLLNPLDVQAKGFELGQQELAAQRQTQQYEQQQQNQRALKDAFQNADLSTQEGVNDLARKVGSITGDPTKAQAIQENYAKQKLQQAQISEQSALAGEHRAKQAELTREAFTDAMGEFVRVGTTIQGQYESDVKSGKLPVLAQDDALKSLKKEADSLRERFGDNPQIASMIQKIEAQDSYNPDQAKQGLARIHAMVGQLKQPPAIPGSPEDLKIRESEAAAAERGRQSEKPDKPEKPESGWEVKEVQDEQGKPQVVRVNKNTGEVRPVEGIKPKSGGMGARESVFTNRVLLSGNEAARDLENVVNLPIGASRGLFGGRTQGAGLFEASKESLANKMTTQDVQSYNVMATGFQRSLAAIESAGLAPQGTLTHQMDAVIFKEGDTNFTKLHKLAQVRQIVEAGLEVLQANPRLSDQEKKKASDILDRIHKAVPFSNADIIKLEYSDNPKATLRSIMPKAEAGAGYEDPDKEKRYQEWKRAHGG